MNKIGGIQTLLASDQQILRFAQDDVVNGQSLTDDAYAIMHLMSKKNHEIDPSTSLRMRVRGWA